MSRGPDAATLLERALLTDAAAVGFVVTVPQCTSTRWASATFTGARHELTLIAPVCAAKWLAGLSEAELKLRNHLLADLAIVRQHRADGLVTATIAALTVEEQ